jgi:hypothetical protein
MDPIHPWIDLSETRRMAERLLSPSREPVIAPDDSGFDDSFVGFSEPSDDVGFAEAGMEPQAEAQPLVEVTADHPPVVPEPQLQVPDDAVLPSSRAALHERFAPLAMFMVDQSGNLVFTEGRFDAFHFVLRDLAATGAPPANNRRLKVGATAVLEIVPIEGEGGCQWLGVVLPQSPSPEEAAHIRTLWITAP